MLSMRFASEKCQVRCFLVMVIESALHGSKPCWSSKFAQKWGYICQMCAIFLGCPAPLPFWHVQLRVCVITCGTTCHLPVWCCTGTPNSEKQGPSVLVLSYFDSFDGCRSKFGSTFLASSACYPLGISWSLAASLGAQMLSAGRKLWRLPPSQPRLGKTSSAKTFLVKWMIPAYADVTMYVL